MPETHPQSGAGPRASRQARFKHSLDPTLLCGDDRRVRSANIAACLLLRSTREDLLGYRVDDLIPADRHAELEAMWATPSPQRHDPASPARLSCELVMPDGGRLDATLTVARGDLGLHLVTLDFPPARTFGDRGAGTSLPDRSTLTTRERQVLAMVAVGRTGVEIAAQLFLSPATVQTHVTNALLKLEAKNRAHGIAIAVQTGEIDPEGELDGAADGRDLASWGAR